MAEYESFDTKNKKFRKLWNRINGSEEELEDIPLIDVKYLSNNFGKKIISIPLLTGEQLTSLSTNVLSDSVFLANFPDWAIPMSKLFAVLYTEEGQDVDDPDRTTSFNYEINHWFQKIDNTHYLLKMFLGAQWQQISPAFAILPLFVDITLEIRNERNFDQITKGKE